MWAWDVTLERKSGRTTEIRHLVWTMHIIGKY